MLVLKGLEFYFNVFNLLRHILVSFFITYLFYRSQLINVSADTIVTEKIQCKDKQNKHSKTLNFYTILRF